jgi:membrane-bound serine protease (ClpP class)
MLVCQTKSCDAYLYFGRQSEAGYRIASGQQIPNGWDMAIDRSRRRDPLLTYLGILACLVFLAPQSLSATAEAPSKVYVIPVSGEVDPGMAAFIKRTMIQYGQDPSALLVLEMDTFGGRVDSALEIVDHLTNLPKTQVITLVTKRAISAGALISLAADRLFMHHHTLIGDCAPIMMSAEGPMVMGEKIQSPLRAQFRSLAKKNGYPELLAESMVTMEMIVYEVTFPEGRVYMDAIALADLPPAKAASILEKRTVVAEGELLTMDDVEAVRLGFSQASVGSLEEMLVMLGDSDRQVVRVRVNWSERFVRYIGSIAQVLMLIGLGALYLEYKSPGFGVFGILGLFCLGLVFFNQYMVGLADYTELLLLMIGLLLLAVEMFVLPGFGIAGFAGLTVIGISLVLMMQDFVIPDPALPWQGDLLLRNSVQVLVTFLLMFFVSLAILRFVFPRLSTGGKGPYLDGNLQTSHIAGARDKGVCEGDIGTAETVLRPAGKIRVGDQRLDAISRGEFIEARTAIEIVKIDGNRIIVAVKGQP